MIGHSTPGRVHHYEKVAAQFHVRERVKVDGDHRVTGCPRYTRAMCKYTEVIKAAVADGTWPEDLPSA